MYTDVVFRICPFSVSGKNFSVDLVKIEMQGFDVILGRDCLAKNRVIIDCKRKLVSLTTLEGEKLKHKGSSPQKSISIIFIVQAITMMRKDWQSYLCAVKVGTPNEPNLSQSLAPMSVPEVFKDVP